ncbi:MAG: DUF3352 domain-containing protein [Solirubrobacterales bacterium]
MKLRLVLLVLLAAATALLAAGCGGGGDSSSGTDPASVVPAKAPAYLDFTLRPEGETKKNIEELAKNLAGVNDLGGLIVAEIERAASEDNVEIEFEEDVEPWLGEEGGLFLQEYANEDFEEAGAAIQVTNEGEAREFLEKQVGSEGEPAKKGSYEGVDFWVEPDGTTLGVFDGLGVFADSEAVFKSMVEASNGENLGEEGAFTEAIDNVPDESAADVYVDVGGLIEEAGGEINPETQLFLDSVGIEPKEATAVASLIPGSNQVEVDISTNLSGDNPPSGDASELLGSLPADSVGALASAEFGKRFNEGIDKIDEQGIPGQVPPHQLMKGLKEAGIDLEAIASSIGDVGLFVEGNSERNLSGALVLTTEDATQAKNTVSSLGLFLRASGTPGVTAINGKASGFSIRSPELGRQPVVVISKDKRIAIGYGLESALAGVEEGGETLADSPTYKEAVSALGNTPITAFVDGPAALKLASALVPPGEEGFTEAKKYLTKIDYLALGSEASGGLATAKLIVGVGK